MGCTQSKAPQVLTPFPQPKGEPSDPLASNADIIDAIVNDPHIHFFQKKLFEVIMPLKKCPPKLKDISNQMSKTNYTMQSNTTSKNFRPSNKGSNALTIETYATTDKKQHEKYVQSVNEALRNNDASVTNIMAYMIQEMADIREGKKAQNKFGNESYAALKCFIFLYTGHYTYRRINSQLRRSQYQKISAVIAVVQKQLEEYNKEKFARKLKANKKLGQFLNLYRGIPKPDKSIVKGKKQYWKGFTSTSLQNAVASKFGKYLYIINLDKTHPHAYMIVPEQLSQFKEQQIILFPYFYFQCTNHEDYMSGARYECKQTFCTAQ